MITGAGISFMTNESDIEVEFIPEFDKCDLVSTHFYLCELHTLENKIPHPCEVNMLNNIPTKCNISAFLGSMNYWKKISGNQWLSIWYHYGLSNFNSM